MADLLMGRTPDRRLTVKFLFISVASYAAYLGVLALQVAMGLAPLLPTVVMGLVAVVVNLGFYAIIRSGLGERPAWRRPLGWVQLVVGMAAFWGTYAVAGPSAPGTTIIVSTHVLYSSFGGTGSRVKKLAALDLVALTVVMAVCSWLQPERYPPSIQLVTFLYLLVALPILIRVAGEIAHMQSSLVKSSQELAEALEMVQRLATVDELTDVHNRRSLTTLLDHELDLCQRTGTQLCLALVDIDHFKAINDRFGHASGDDVLQRFARAATGAVRQGDLVGRWGGEEFVLVFPDTSSDTALTALRRVQGAIGGDTFFDIADRLTVTFSAGLAVAQPGETSRSLVERADLAMYRAKAAGRDRIELASDEAAVLSEPSEEAFPSGPAGSGLLPSHGR